MYADRVPRHHLFLCDFAPLRRNLEATVGEFIDFLTEVEKPTERLGDYAEMAFGGYERPWVTGYTKDTYRTLRQPAVDVRKGVLALEGMSQRLAARLDEHVRGSTSAQFCWLLHAYKLAGADWIRELACGIPGECLAALRAGLASAPDGEFARERIAGIEAGEPTGPFDWTPQDAPGRFGVLAGDDVRRLLTTLELIEPDVSVFPMPDAPQNLSATPKVREFLHRLRQSGARTDPILLAFRR